MNLDANLKKMQSELDKQTIAMLKSLIKNLEAGNIITINVDMDARVHPRLRGQSELRFIFYGTPDRSL